jgi:hypothetical protein
MELPEDVLTIVRAYAKPRFKYFREYNGITKLLGREWPALKEKLQTDPEPILPALLAYQYALSSQIKYRQEMEVLRASPSWHESWELQNQSLNIVFYRTRDAENRFWTLNRLLYSGGSFYTYPFM